MSLQVGTITVLFYGQEYELIDITDEMLPMLTELDGGDFKTVSAVGLWGSIREAIRNNNNTSVFLYETDNDIRFIIDSEYDGSGYDTEDPFTDALTDSMFLKISPDEYEKFLTYCQINKRDIKIDWIREGF